MNKVKELVLNKNAFLFVSRFVFLVGLATIVPLFHQQFITGPIVNAVLFISTIVLGVDFAILIGLIPSVIALGVGLLPAVLAPMVPFIMISNTLLVVCFAYLRKKNYWLGIVVSSFLKFIFLFSTSSIVINLILKKEVAEQASLMMSWPQLFTALAGGILAYLVLRVLGGFKNK